MLDYEWEYIISGVDSKDPTKRNSHHDQIIGKRCIVPDPQEMPSICGQIIIEQFGDHFSSRWLYTTPIRAFNKMEDGSIVMETKNTVYTFTPIKKE